MDPQQFLSRKDPPTGLEHRETRLHTQSLTGITSLHVQQILPALPVLAKLVYSLDDEVLIDACWAISYLSDGANDKIQAVIEAGIPRRLVELLMHASTSVQTPADRSVGNI